MFHMMLPYRSLVLSTYTYIITRLSINSTITALKASLVWERNSKDLGSVTYLRLFLCNVCLTSLPRSYRRRMLRTLKRYRRTLSFPGSTSEKEDLSLVCPLREGLGASRAPGPARWTRTGGRCTKRSTGSAAAARPYRIPSIAPRASQARCRSGESRRNFGTHRVPAERTRCGQEYHFSTTPLV